MTVVDNTSEYSPTEDYDIDNNLPPKYRRYVIIPAPGSDMPTITFTIGSDAPGIEPYKIIIEHNDANFTYTIAECCKELENEQGLRDWKDNPLFDVTDKTDWDMHLQPFTTTNEYQSFAHKVEIALHDADEVHQQSIGVLEGLLEVLQNNSVIARGDANRIILLEEQYAGYGKSLDRGK